MLCERAVNRGAGIVAAHAGHRIAVQAARADDAAVKRFHSVECSLDFPTEDEHDRFRGELGGRFGRRDVRCHLNHGAGW